MSRSLGQLTLDLIAKIGGWTKGLTEAERVADQKQKEIVDKAKKRSKEFEKEWKDATKFVAATFGALTIGATFGKFITETVQAEQAQTQLAAALKSTGSAAGFSQQQLNVMADQLSAIIPDTDSITRAQTVLLKYVDIVGVQFTQALQLAGDMAARTGGTIEDAADIIGKALNSPAEGLGKLRKLGLNFTDAQIDGLQVLVDTGRKVEAQSVILDGLARSYGGAAAAARDTLGGSLVALREALNDLLTGGRGVTGLREGLESLTRTLQSQAVRDGFAYIVRALAGIAEGALKVVSAFATFGTVLGQQIARATGAGAADPIERLNDDIDLLKTNISSLNRGLAQSKAGTEPYREMSREVTRLTAEMEQATAARAQLVREANNPVQARRPVGGGGSAIPTMAELEALGARKKAADGAKSSIDSAIKATDAYIKQLQNQINNLDQVTVYERTLQQIRDGTLKGPRTAEALELAKQVDLLKQKADLLAIVKRNNEAEAQATQQVHQEIEGLIKGNEQLREEIKLVGLEGSAREAMVLQLEKEVIARKELELIGLQNAGASAERIAALQREIELLRQRSDLRTERDEKTRIDGMVQAGPNAQADAQIQKMVDLKKALDAGRISVAQYEDALNGLWGSVKQGAATSETLIESFGQSFAQAFADAITGGKSLKEVFFNLYKAITNAVIQLLVIEPIIKQIKKILGEIQIGGSGGSGGGSGGGIGKFFSSIFSSFFGGGGGASYAEPFFGPRAGGGPALAGGAYLVGENGPELFRPSTSGYVLPAGTTAGMMRGGSQTLNVYVQAAPSMSRSTAMQQGLVIGKGVQQSLRRNG